MALKYRLMIYQGPLISNHLKFKSLMNNDPPHGRKHKSYTENYNQRWLLEIKWALKRYQADLRRQSFDCESWSRETKWYLGSTKV